MAHPLPQRRSLRLKSYDYAQAGAYFVTICTQSRACLFGDIVDDRMCPNDAGHLVAVSWNDIRTRFPDVEIDIFVVMPNHLHGIIVLPDVTDARGRASQSALCGTGMSRATGIPSLGNVVGAFKSAATVEYIHGVKTKGWMKFRRPLWQRSYY
jgi:putative transposase